MPESLVHRQDGQFADLQAQIVALKQENLDLRSRLQACEQSQANFTQEHRWLEAIATAANALLTTEPFDAAINIALQIIGEAVDTDRVTVIENLDHSADSLLVYWRVLYEWHSPHTVAQVSHPDLAQGTWEGIEEWYERCRRGEGVSCLLEDMPEPFRSGQAAIGVKALHIVPIFVQDHYWGLIGFDDCRAAQHRSAAELAVLQIAADCIGSAIQRERTQQALLQAEQECSRSAAERSQELAKANQVLQRSLDSLASEPSLDKFLGQVLTAIAAQFDSPLAEYWYYPENTAYIGMMSWHGQIYSRDEIAALYPNHSGVIGHKVPSDQVHGESLQHRKQYFITEDWDTDPFTHYERWYPEHGFYQEINVPMVLGDECIGALVVRLPRGYQITTQQIELAQALAHQATLAIQLTQLAEEAKQAAIACEREKVAQERAALLERINFVLQRSTERLSATVDPKAIIVETLRTSAEVLTPLGVKGIGLIRYQPTSRTVRVMVHILDGVEQTIAGSDLDGDWAVDSPAMVVPWRRIQSENFVWGLTSDTEVLIPEVRHYHESRGARAIAYVPLRRGEETVGWIGFDLASEMPPTQQQIDMIRALTSQVLLAVEMERLSEAARKAAIAREQEKAAQERAAELAKTNEALKRSLTLLAREPSLDKFLGYVLQTIADQLGDRSGAVYLYSEPDHISLMHLNYENGHLQQGDRITHPAATLPRPPQAWDDQFLPLLHQNQILVHHAAEFDSPAYAPYRQHNRDRGIQTLLIVPLLFGDRLLGSLTLRSTQHRDYSPEELELARALAQQATLAIQLTQLADQRRQTAVLEERNRMARDIHDTLAQSFTGIIMQLEATKNLPSSNNADVHNSLNCIGELARLGLAEARRSVRALRLEALETTDFATALRHLLRQTTHSTSIRATLEIEGTPKPLSPCIEENLLRIAQEAITNAIRHGHAQTITVQLLFEFTTVHLQISDDGTGFDPHSISFSGFGLLGMQERTDQLNGQFHLVSQPGQGTAITVSVPI